MPYTPTSPRRSTPTPMSDAEAARIERQTRETLRRADEALTAGARRAYLKTVRATADLVASAKLDGVRPDRRPEALRRNADVINAARVSEFERRRAAWRELGYSEYEAADLAMRPPAKSFGATDANGKRWTHPDGEYLARWILERNRTLLRAKSPASPSRSGWRADGEVEHKAVLPSYR